MSIGLATLVRRCRPRIFCHLDICRFASSEGKPEIESLDLEPAVSDEAQQEDVIEKLRDKSMLGPAAYSKIHKKPPSLTEDEKQVFPLRRLRRTYGEYGSASGVNVGLLWPSKEELELQKEWERVAYPHNVLQMIEMAKKSQEDEEQKILKRQEDLSQKVAKLEDWKQEVRHRVAKQAKLANDAKEKKERVMEEVRKMFGFRIDYKDERFKEALEKKELEEKRAAKAAKKLKRQLKAMEEIKKMAQQAPTEQEDGNTGGNLEGTSVVPVLQPPTKPKS